MPQCLSRKYVLERTIPHHYPAIYDRKVEFTVLETNKVGKIPFLHLAAIRQTKKTSWYLRDLADGVRKWQETVLGKRKKRTES
jgi:hypothetical protein